MKRFFSRIPATVAMPALLVLPLLLVSGVLITVATVRLGATTGELVSQNMTQIHRRIEQRVGDVLSLPRQVTEINVGLIEQGRLDADDPRSWQETLARESRAFEILSAITWGDETGRSTWVARYAGETRLVYAIKDGRTGSHIEEFLLDDDGAITGGLFNHYEFDPRVRPWYRTPADAGRPVWTLPFVWVGGDPSIEPTLGISYGRPVYGDDGALVGVIDSELTLDDMSDFLKSLEIAESGVVFITDENGLLMANSAGAKVTKGTEVLAAVESENDVIAAAATRLGGDVPVGGHEQVMGIGGERWWLRISRMEHETGLAWTISTLVPEREFMGAIAAARRRSIAIVITAVVVTALLGVGLALLMVRPLLNLEAHARRIGEGDLDTELALHQSPELTRLSKSINDMTAGLRDRIRLRRSLELAMQVQQSLLPSGSPRIKGLDIAGHSTYCDETGGDYYDFLEVTGLTGNSVAVALGDVMGHGVAAAMLMATARGILRSSCRVGGSLADLLTHLNELLAHDTGGKRFMTMLLMIVEVENRKVRWASAGHGPPTVYDPVADEYLDLEGGDLPLGLVADVQYEEYEIPDLPPGAVVLAATDGVWEAPGPDGDRYGMERVFEQIRRTHALPAEEIAEKLRHTLAEYMGQEAQEDDVTFVVLRVQDRDGGNDDATVA
jgi:sigma-B regulation protein RsbU (phosphoserine phosphatase)